MKMRFGNKLSALKNLLSEEYGRFRERISVQEKQAPDYLSSWKMSAKDLILGTFQDMAKVSKNDMANILDTANHGVANIQRIFRGEMPLPLDSKEHVVPERAGPVVPVSEMPVANKVDGKEHVVPERAGTASEEMPVAEMEHVLPERTMPIDSKRGLLDEAMGALTMLRGSMEAKVMSSKMSNETLRYKVFSFDDFVEFKSKIDSIKNIIPIIAGDDLFQITVNTPHGYRSTFLLTLDDFEKELDTILRLYF